jgi:hypothetical protein
MTEQAWSWEKALAEGALTEMQWETLQSLVDNGEAEDLTQAARLLDYEETHRAGGEPERLAY